jgi:cystathionine gamma-synthase
MTRRTRHPATAAVRAGVAQDSSFGAVIPPLHLSATYAFEGYAKPRKYDYGRTGNPTRDLLAGAVSNLEGGAGACITATGMAAVGLPLNLVKAGERVIAPHDAYGGTRRLLLGLARQGKLVVDFIDFTAPGALEAALATPARLIWVETPSNPLLRISDIRAACELGHARGALVGVDNTFLSPALQRPIEHGADLVVHSTTKYLNGHSDVVGGAVIAKDAVLHEELAWWCNATGVPGAPFDAWLTLRGVRTLHARVRSHLENTARVVETLLGHPAVSWVHYPGLADHPGHVLAKRQQDGFGAIVSFELEGGVPAVRAFVEGLTTFTLAESLGGVESLVAHPATMTHASMDADARRAAGLGDNLLRLSVGIEDADDLADDLRAGLARAAQASKVVRPPRTVRRTGISLIEEGSSV